MKVQDSLGCSGNAMVEFSILKERSKANRITTLDVRRADFGLFTDRLGRIP